MKGFRDFFDRRDGKPAPKQAQELLARQGLQPGLLIAYTSPSGRPGFVAADAIEYFEEVDPEFTHASTGVRTKSGEVIMMRESFTEVMERLCLVSEP